MKIAITSQGTDWDALTESRFGRARFLLIVELESGQLSIYDNGQHASEMQGAGIQTAQTLAKLGVQTLLTGTVGPKAQEILRVADITVYTGVTGTVAEAIERFRAGQRSDTAS